jgi:hypothetical protein
VQSDHLDLDPYCEGFAVQIDDEKIADGDIVIAMAAHGRSRLLGTIGPRGISPLDAEPQGLPNHGRPGALAWPREPRSAGFGELGHLGACGHGSEYSP